MTKMSIVAVVAVVFLVGCSTTSPPKNLMINVPAKSDEQIANERLNLRLAKYFAVFKCPTSRTFKEHELSQARNKIFEGKNDWVIQFDAFLQSLTGGDVQVMKGKTTDIGLYAGKKISIKVFSTEKSRVYTIYEKRDDVYCDEPVADGLMYAIFSDS